MADMRDGAAAGFTLIEVLVAFAILAVSFAALFEAFGSALDRSGRSERQLVATMLARSKLAAVGLEAPLKEGDDSGRTEDGFSWQVAVGPARAGGTDALVAAHPVRVTVDWREGAAVRSLILETLRLRPAEARDDS